MEPPSKRIRVGADDRLSDLPDCLVHSILSFLESRQVVRSSLLSQRWRHLWRSVPCIDIDQTVFRHGDRCRDRKCCRNYAGNNACKKEWRPFEQFSNNLLQLHAVRSLERLRIHVPSVLDCWHRQSIRPCFRWISRGVECSPTAIDIHMDFNWTSRWSKDNYGLFPDWGSTSRRLTKLQLHGVSLDVSFAEQLRSGYHVLEDLSLVSCVCHFGEIVSESLRQLAIVDCYGDPKLFMGIEVAAPRLTYLRASVSTMTYPNGIHVTNTSSFTKASVCVTRLECWNDTFWDRLCKIFDVRHLELFDVKTMDELQWMANMGNNLPSFHSMRTLLIDGCVLKTNANIQTLDRFLQSVPALEKLTLKNCEFSGRSKKRNSRTKGRNVALESQNLMSFKCENLDVIEIKHGKHEKVDELFELLMGLWRNLGKASIKLTKV